MDNLKVNLEMAIDMNYFTDILSSSYFGNTILDYLIFFAILAVSIVLGKVVYYIIVNFIKKFAEKTETMMDDIIVDALDHPLVFFIFIIGLYVAYNTLNLNESVVLVFSNIVKILFIIDVAWFMFQFIDSFIHHYIIPLTEKTKTTLDDALVPIGRKLVKVIIVAIALIMIFDKFGYDITSLVAGLGIGGLAFALAAKDMLSNMFGGVSILTDKPFSINQRIRFDGNDGYVRSVGLRSSKVETFDGTQLVVPNSIIANAIIENVTREDRRRIKFFLGLTYDTSTTKMKKAMTILRKIIKEQTGAEDCKVFFDEFADSSLNLMVIYWISDLKNILKIKSDVNMRIKIEFEKEGIDFAFPTQTLYLQDEE